MIARTNRRAFALVIILGALVFLTVLILAFFSRALLNRQVAFSSTNLAKADALARSGLEIVAGELRQEIADGSSVLNGGDPGFPPVYQPLAATNARPVRMGVDSPDGTGSHTLAKVSAAGQALRPMGTNAASPVLVSSPSVNGRRISAERWFGSGGPGLGSQTNLPAWFYVTRGNGVRTPPLADAKDRANGDFVIGRFACTVYDVSGLLDANVAGYPSAAATNAPAKSSAAWADLTALDPGLDPALASGAVDDFVEWRNGSADTASGPAYGAFLADFAMPRGFLQCQLGHNALVTRKDLLNAAQHGLLPGDWAASFTHFSRAVSAPGSGPSENSDAMAGYAGGDGTAVATYADDANAAASANRFFPNVRFPAAVTLTRYSDEGTAQSYTAAAGSPLVSRRFSLAKLAWLGFDGPRTGISGEAIEADFGLRWNNGEKRWDYTALTGGGRIATLAEVAAAQREPNFFELLKAGILAGSLGRDPGAIIQTGAFPANRSFFEGVCGDGFEVYSASIDRHVAQLAANIIDQADIDGYPTAISIPLFSNPALPEQEPVNLCFGIENLPYLHKVHYVALGYGGLNAAGGPARYAGWLQPELWNPHQAPAGGAGAKPSQFRVTAAGQAYIFYSTGTTTVQSPPLDFNTATAASVYFDDSGGTSSAFYAQPQALTTSNADTASTPAENVWQSSYANLITDSTLTFNPDDAANLNQFVGIHIGDIAFHHPNTNSNNPKHRIIPSPMVTFRIEFRDASGDYRPYGYMSRLRSYYYADRPTVGSSRPKISYLRPDPRTDRFSAGINSGGAGGQNVVINDTYQPGAASMRRSIMGWPQASAGFTYNKSDGTRFLNDKYLGDWVTNLSSGETYYADPDGVNRPGDGFRRDASTGDGFLLSHASSEPASATRRRPVVLDRPFRTVAELGYAFRDTPFKTLDFFSSGSADGALLDIFSVTEEPGQTAGKINPGSASEAVLRAVLQGAGKDAAGSSLTVSGTQASNLAAAVVAQTVANPLLDQAELAGPLADAINNALIDPAEPDTKADKANKTRGEAPVRALSAASQVRTWNLLVDLVAQAGRLPQTAANLQNFAVEGERRYWLHLAIDRTTGKIVSRQLEPVYE